MEVLGEWVVVVGLVRIAYEEFECSVIALW